MSTLEGIVLKLLILSEESGNIQQTFIEHLFAKYCSMSRGYSIELR